jgi:hypothetical protein
MAEAFDPCVGGYRPGRNAGMLACRKMSKAANCTPACRACFAKPHSHSGILGISAFR